MPLAVTHVLASVVATGLYRDHVTKHKKYFTLHTVFLAGLFGLLPDIDIALRMIAAKIGFDVPLLLQHGGITHTPFFAALFFIPGFALWARKKHKIGMYFFVGAAMIMLHILLDYVLGGGNHEGIMFLFPFMMNGWKIHLLGRLGLKDVPMALDAVILLSWLWYIEVKHRITDFV